MRSIARQFELSRHGTASNVRPMEGLRGFAVFLVFLVHYVTLSAPWIAAATPLAAFAHALHTLGNAGVDLFFVLSGYLIYGSIIARAQAFLPFMRRRIVRIYPAFCVVFALYLALSLAVPDQSKIPASGFAACIYVLQNFLLLPGLFPIEPIITVAWSLSYEMFYYLAIPFAVALLRLRARSARWRVLFFAALGAAFAGYCALWGGPARLLMFIAGILLSEALRSGALPAPRSALALACLIAGLLATMLSGPGMAVVKVVLLCASFFSVCYACFSQPEAALARAFSWTPLRWLGNMSYSYYLLHGLALKCAFIVLMAVLPPAGHDALVFFGLMPLMFALTLVPSAALFLLVERPFSLAGAVRAPAFAAPATAQESS